MQEAEARAFAAGASAAELMEQAGAGIAQAITQFYPRPGTAVLYLGKGNNAGDALVAARHLHAIGWRLLARLSAPVEQFKPLPLEHFRTLGGSLNRLASPLTASDAPPGPLILLDGLLGIGATGPLQASLAALASEMNALRREAHAQVIALDIPSGLDGDTGRPHPNCVEADLAIIIAQVKAGLVADGAVNHAGRLALARLPALADCEGDTTAALSTPTLLRPWLPRRPFDTHKAQAGRVLVLAGSPGLLGAAELACRSALHAGAGLVTLLTKAETYPLLAARPPAEVMVKPAASYLEALDLPHDTLVIGPGLGRAVDAEIRAVLARDTAPAVVDADALNALAPLEPAHTHPGPRLLTPHPGEWRRLAPDLADSGLDRRRQAEAFCARHPQVTLLLKGARTLIACQGEPTRINSTGHPGMATGGMGDVLSGVLGALLAQGVAAAHGAALGAWLCGRAAERAALTKHPHSVLPTDVVRHLGAALQDLVESSF